MSTVLQRVARNLTTPRLDLEPLRVVHAKQLFPLLRDPTLWVFVPRNPPNSVEELANRYRRLEGRRSPDGKELWLNWVGFVRDSENTPPAVTVEATIKSDGSALIAYATMPGAQRKGYGREAVGAMLVHLLGTVSVKRFISKMDTRNTRSIALVESLGFTRKLTSRAPEPIRGEPADEHVYEIAGPNMLPELKRRIAEMK